MRPVWAKKNDYQLCSVAPWHDVNEIPNENTQMAYLTDKTRLTPTIASFTWIREIIVLQLIASTEHFIVALEHSS